MDEDDQTSSSPPEGQPDEVEKYEERIEEGITGVMDPGSGED